MLIDQGVMQVKDFFFATVGDVMKAQKPRRRGGGGLSPSLFRKNENKLNKNNLLTKVTEPKIAPHSKTCCAIPEETLSL